MYYVQICELDENVEVPSVYIHNIYIYISYINLFYWFNCIRFIVNRFTHFFKVVEGSVIFILQQLQPVDGEAFWFQFEFTVGSHVCAGWTFRNFWRRRALWFHEIHWNYVDRDKETRVRASITLYKLYLYKYYIMCIYILLYC